MSSLWNYNFFFSTRFTIAVPMCLAEESEMLERIIKTPSEIKWLPSMTSQLGQHGAEVNERLMFWVAERL